MEIIFTESRPEWLRWISEYKDALQLSFAMVGLAAIYVSAQIFKNSVDQRSFNEVLQLNSSLEPETRIYQDADGNDKESHRLFWQSVTRVLNIIEVVIVHINRRKTTKYHSQTLSSMFFMMIENICQQKKFQKDFARVVRGRYYEEIKIFLIRSYYKISPDERSNIYKYFFDEHEPLIEDNRLGKQARRILLRKLEKNRAFG